MKRQCRIFMIWWSTRSRFVDNIAEQSMAEFDLSVRTLCLRCLLVYRYITLKRHRMNEVSYSYYEIDFSF